MSHNRKKLESMLEEFQKRRDFSNMEYERCPEGTLYYIHDKKRPPVFQHSHLVDGRRRRESLRGKDALLAKLAHRIYLKEELNMLNRAIGQLEQLLAVYEEPAAEAVMTRFPAQLLHPPLTENMILSGKPDPAASQSGTSTGGQICGQAGNLDGENLPWAEQPYEQGNYLPQHRRHLTSRGLKVRSKSEVLIVELLYRLNIEFRYEEVLHIGTKTFIPDFTIRRRDGKLLYYEHFGMPSDPRYRLQRRQKLDAYEAAGIVPWDNLIVSYDSTDGEIDIRMIELELRHKVLDE